MDLKRNLLTGGLRLTLLSWPAVVFTYLVNLVLALFFTLPLHFQIQAITGNSLASQRLISGFDLGTLAAVTSKLGEGPGPATAGSYFSIPVYLLLYFLIVPGVLVCYQTGASAAPFSLFQSGFAYWWRFVRITLLTLVIAGPIVAGVMQLQNLWSDHLDKATPTRATFLLGLAGTAAVFLVAALLRVYFDLVEVYTVQLGLRAAAPSGDGKPGRERQIRRALKPAWNALRHNFFRTYLSFLLLTALGFAACALAVRGALHSLAQPRALPIFLLLQLGLLLMLLTRFWQRGVETMLALRHPVQAEAIRTPQSVAEPAPAEPAREAGAESSAEGDAEFSI